MKDVQERKTQLISTQRKDLWFVENIREKMRNHALTFLLLIVIKQTI